MIAVALLAAYTFAVSIAYAAIYTIWPGLASGLLILFVGLILIPACVHDIKRSRKRRRR